MLCYAMLSHFSRVRLCATPQMAAHQAPPSLDSPGKNTGVGCHFLLQCRKEKSESEVAQSCLTLSDPMDGSLPGSPIPGILQARTLEWLAISFSNAGKRKVKVKSLSHVRLFATPWTAAYQAPPSMGFSGQEYWSGVPSPSPKGACGKLKKKFPSERSQSDRAAYCILSARGCSGKGKTMLIKKISGWLERRREKQVEHRRFLE